MGAELPAPGSCLSLIGISMVLHTVLESHVPTVFPEDAYWKVSPPPFKFRPCLLQRPKEDIRNGMGVMGRG